MADFSELDQAEFEELFQEFVRDGGLDSTLVINEAYERAFKATLCKHHRLVANCELCYRPPPPYFSYGT